MSYDPARNTERSLARPYEEFEKEVRPLYDSDTVDQRMRMVRQFCQFLAYGTPPTKHNPPGSPRP